MIEPFRNAIPSPATGLQIFNSTTNQPEFFDGVAWQSISGVPTTPGGVNTEIQFNNAGLFDGSPDFVFTGSAVGIGTSTPDTSAALDITSNVSGFLPPRLTTIERDAILIPATGLEVFNTTTNQPEYFDGIIWKAIASITNPGGANTEIQFNNAGSFDGSADFVFNGSAVGIGTNSPDPSTALEINSIVSGFLKPVMTTVQRDAIPSPVDGLEIYNSTTNQPEYFDGIIWKSVSALATNPAGANTQIQFNDAGAFGADADFVFNGLSVGIGTSTPVANAVLEINSTTQGFLPSRMTTTQRNAIPSPESGLMLYNTSQNRVNVFNGSSWKKIAWLSDVDD